MIQLVFALVVTEGANTISVEHWSGIETCLYYASKLNSQHVTDYNHTHSPDHTVIHAQCVPVRVNRDLVEIFDH